MKTPKQPSGSSQESQFSVNIINDKITNCANLIQDIQRKMNAIETQGGWHKFWNQQGNIDLIVKHVQNLAQVQQDTFDVIILLLAASGNIKNDYDLIVSRIDELSEIQEWCPEAFEYFRKVKSTLDGIKYTDDHIRHQNSRISKLESQISPGAKKYNYIHYYTYSIIIIALTILYVIVLL
jgi:hypothetical protein